MSAEADDPPSYESVVANLVERLGANPKIENIFKAGAQLSKKEADVLITHAYVAPSLTAEEKKEFTRGACRSWSSPEGKTELRKEAHQATAAILGIEANFRNLNSQLVRIQNQYRTSPDFVSRLRVFNNTFNVTIRSSRELATRISHYAFRFDDFIMPRVVQSPTLAVETKIRQLQIYIDDAKAFQIQSDTIIDDYSKLALDFTSFTGEFGDWSKNVRGPHNEQLDRLKRDLESLRSKLKNKKQELAVVTQSAVTVGLVVKAARLLRGIISALIAIRGLIAARKETRETTALIAAISATEGNIDSHEKQIANLENTLASIDVTQGQLQEQGEESVVSLDGNLETLKDVWRDASQDCVLIQDWLRNGQQVADEPEFLEYYTDGAIRVYDSMRAYLDDYARGVRDFSETPQQTEAEAEAEAKPEPELVGHE